MAKIIKLGSTKRFGPRYGRRTKERLAEIEKGHKGKQKCPYCKYVGVKRLSKGIWTCSKCNAKFAGRAYSLKEVMFTKTKKEEKSEDKGV